jgi:hypothetical protein
MILFVMAAPPSTSHDAEQHVTPVRIPLRGAVAANIVG